MELGSVTLKRIGFFVFQLNTQHTLMQMSWCSDLSTSVAMRDASGQASPELNDIRRVYELGDIGHIVIDIGLGFVT